MAHAGRTWEAHVPQQVSLEGASDLARHSSQQPSAGVTPRRVPEISILWKRNSKQWFTDKLCKAYEFMSHRIMILYLINESVLREIGVERELLRTLKNRKKKWLGHIMRWNSLYRTIIEGKLEGRGRGRRRPTLLGNLGGGRSYRELKRMAEDREGWRLSNL